MQVFGTKLLRMLLSSTNKYGFVCVSFIELIQYKYIIGNYTSKFTKFDMDYYDFPLQEAVDDYTSKGGNITDLIEPVVFTKVFSVSQYCKVDGFHPSQVLNALLAKIMWQKIQSDHPNWFGEANPNNSQIRAIFGDQGGY